MANTYDWRINTLNAKIKQGDKENVIFNIHWSLMASDDSVPAVQAYSYGTHGVKYTEGESFINYSDLKKSDVVGWLESGMDVDKLKKHLDDQIELKKNPIDETLTPEWD
tara:strand:+ start:996 stop:1322 length:327 start_codon:yes stop_codon:yes gene_type:complete